MPKTNHNRNYYDPRNYSSSGRDFTNGKHGEAKDKRGRKKFRRSRQRFSQNQEIKKLVGNEDAVLSVTKFDKRWGERSKLSFKNNNNHSMIAPDGYKFVRIKPGKYGWRSRDNGSGIYKLEKI